MDTAETQTLHLLLVADSEPHIALICESLNFWSRPVDINIARSLAEGRAFLDGIVPDLLIIDLVLLDGGGVDILPADKQKNVFPTVIITDKDDVQVAVESLRAGALDYVSKSAEVLADMPRIVTRVLRDWNNIAERKQAEAALRESEARFRSIFEFAASGIALVSPIGQMLRVNPAICQFFGYNEEQLMKKDTISLTHPDDKEKTRRSYEDILLGNREVVDLEKRYISAYDDIVWGHTVLTGVYDSENKKLLYIVVMLQDITEKKQAEVALRAAQKQQQSIIEFLPDPTFVIDRDSKVIAWNRAIEDMTGISKDEIIGQGDFAYAVPFLGKPDTITIDLLDAPIEEVEKKYQWVKRRGGILFTEQYRASMHGGKGAHIWAAAAPFYDDDGNQVGAIETLRDVTERKTIEEELKETNEGLEAFTYSVSHDLRSPLTPIIGYAELLQETYEEQLDEQGLDMLDKIATSGNRMLALMENLLSLARTGCIERPAKAIKTAEVVAGVIADLAGLINDIGVQVLMNTLPPAHVQKTFLIQIFDNLIGNAVRYAGQKDELIEVGGERNGCMVRYYVRDHGPGISEEERDRVFEVFYRPTSTSTTQGSGVGLAIVQKIARKYGGSVWLEDTPGGGCTFWVELEDIMPLFDDSSSLELNSSEELDLF